MKITEDTQLMRAIVRRDERTKVATLRGAILANLQVSFIYDGKERIVEVHAIGRSSKDNGLLMRGYQVAGDASRPLPQWTMFRVDGIEALGLTFDASLAPRPGYTTGDKQMTPVLIEIDL